MKGYGTLDHSFPGRQCGVEKMSIELEIYIRLQNRQQPLETASADEFVCCAHVGEGTSAEML
jgi:hypothetical protein